MADQVEQLDAGRYPGGDNGAGVWQWLISEQPHHSVYVEPCVGSGGVFRRKPPALRSVLIDLDPRVAAWWLGQSRPGMEVVSGCGVDWLRRNADWLDRDCLVYLDPPFLHSTRSNRRLYRFEMTRRAHIALLDVVESLRCNVMLSGYWSELYGERLDAWRVERRDVPTRGGLREECLWCNFPAVDRAPPPAVIGPGENYREREANKKRIRRWRDDLFPAMPPAMRRAFLDALIAKEWELSTAAGGG